MYGFDPTRRGSIANSDPQTDKILPISYELFYYLVKYVILTLDYTIES